MKQRITTLSAGSLLALALFGPAMAGPLEDAGAAMERKDYATAAQILRPVAEQGNTEAQLILALIYDEGFGVPQDYEQAAAWYLKAADQGNASAELAIGRMYEHGLGVPEDHVRAHMWYNLAAACGSHCGLRQVENLAAKRRDDIAAKMTPAQIAEAQRLAREWKPK